jgi:curved DNA-binding protein
MAQSYYDILGISRNASDKEVRRAYRRLARELHPDVNPGNSVAAEKFKKVAEAYHVLSVPKTRRDYDEFGDNWKHADQIRNMGGSPGGGHSRAGGESIHDLFNGSSGGFDFADIFGRRGAGGFSAGVASAEGALEISLDEAYHGTTRRVTLGTPAGTRNLEVRIPAGIPDGRRLTLHPEGVEVSLQIHVLPHRLFRREGDNLHTEVPVNLYDARPRGRGGGADA